MTERDKAQSELLNKAETPAEAATSLGTAMESLRGSIPEDELEKYDELTTQIAEMVRDALLDKQAEGENPAVENSQAEDRVEEIERVQTSKMIEVDGQKYQVLVFPDELDQTIYRIVAHDQENAGSLRGMTEATLIYRGDPDAKETYPENISEQNRQRWADERKGSRFIQEVVSDPDRLEALVQEILEEDTQDFRNPQVHSHSTQGDINTTRTMTLEGTEFTFQLQNPNNSSFQWGKLKEEIRKTALAR
jgi:hypothetical protein